MACSVIVSVTLGKSSNFTSLSFSSTKRRLRSLTYGYSEVLKVHASESVYRNYAVTFKDMNANFHTIKIVEFQEINVPVI